MAERNDRKDLGFLGEDFQYKLVKEITEDKELFKDLSNVIDQNMFTNPNLKTYVGVMKEYYDEHDSVPSYDIIKIKLFEKSHSDTEREFYASIVNKIKHTSTEGSDFIRETATKFFKQQNIIKAANKILKIAGNGDVSHYDKCVELLNGALNAGTHDELGSGVFDNEDETLSNDYRVTIPTGIDGIDETLEGGIGKGELGVIVGPSSFGKSQPLDSRIVTPKGFKRMGDMKIGDDVIGRDGKPHKVIGVFPQGLRPIYKITFSNGASCECDEEHLWNVKVNGAERFTTMTLKDIIPIVKQDVEISIPTTKSVQFSDTEVTEDPYTFGSELLENDIDVIPSSIIFNSVDCRQKFLQGLTDKYGINDKDDTYSFCSKNEMLIKQIQFIVRSFGCNATIEKNSDTNEFAIRYSVKRTECITFASIEYIGEKEAQCIMVDSDEHLYLTEDFIVTHNTSLTTAIAGFASTFQSEQNNYEGFKVLQIVFEDRIKQIQRKHFGRITGIESKDLGKPEYVKMVKEQLDHYDGKQMMANNLRILRLPSGEKTAWDIERIIKRFINNGFRPDLVIVDYFECLAHRNDGSQSEWEQEGKTMRKFEAMAGELNIAFWIPLQGTKDSVNIELVTMDKAGGSFKKIQIAHIVMSIARSNEDIAENRATIAILKNRAGRAGKVFNNVEFNNGTCRISTENCDDGIDSMYAFSKKQEQDRANLTSEIFKKFKADKKVPS